MHIAIIILQLVIIAVLVARQYRRQPKQKLSRKELVGILTSTTSEPSKRDPILVGLWKIADSVSDPIIVHELSHDTLRSITVEEAGEALGKDGIEDLGRLGWVIDNDRLSYIQHSFDR